MKKVFFIVLAVVLLSSLVAGTASAKGPTNAGSESVYVPFNPDAFDHALLMIMPLANPFLGSATTIEEDGTTITVSEIPQAVFNEVTEMWEGTHLLLDISRAYDAATYPDAPYYTGEWTKQAWVSYKFWLNGSGPVTITTDDGTIQTVEEVTEFIFFKVQYVGEGMGNSDYLADNSFDVIIQAYK